MLNSPRIWLDRELSAFSRTLSAGCLVLDAGAGRQKYRPKFAHCLYESADFEQSKKMYAAPSTYVCDLSNIPVEDQRFDAVVFTQVMEHLPDPAAVVCELARVLKTGGRLFYTGPFWYEEHEKPYDFYRYTQFGLRRIFEQAGFEVLELRWLDGYLASVAHQLRRMKNSLPWNPVAYGGLLKCLVVYPPFLLLRLSCLVLAPLAAWADSTNRHTASGYPMNYLSVLRKPVK